MPPSPGSEAWSASSALRTTSVYQRSKSSDILVMSLTKSWGSSVMVIEALIVGSARRRTGAWTQLATDAPFGAGSTGQLATVGCLWWRLSDPLCRYRVDLGQEHR